MQKTKTGIMAGAVVLTVVLSFFTIGRIAKAAAVRSESDIAVQRLEQKIDGVQRDLAEIARAQDRILNVVNRVQSDQQAIKHDTDIIKTKVERLSP